MQGRRGWAGGAPARSEFANAGDHEGRPYNRHGGADRLDRFPTARPEPMSEQARETVLCEIDGPLATVTLNRPENLNGITNRMMRELHETLNEVASDDRVRAVLFTGAGRAFCPGADLKAYTSDEKQEPNRPEYFHVTSLLHEMSKVTIAAVNGACAGAGFGWACACDLRYATERAMFNSAFLGVGISGDMAGPWLLPRIVGATKAREIFFTSQKFGAAEALEMGLVLATFRTRRSATRCRRSPSASRNPRRSPSAREEELRRRREPFPARLHRTRNRTPRPHRRERRLAGSLPGVRREARAAFSGTLITTISPLETPTMSTSLYDATVGTFRQILGATANVLEKGRAHCEENGISLDEVVETRLIDDMLPFRFQVISVAHHSLGALKGVEAGVFGPPSMSDLDYDGLRNLVTEAREGLADYSAETVNGFEGKAMEFRMGKMAIPFSAEDFLLTFSLPNFYFHATTTYDMLRMKGTPLGKRDFMNLM